ncbi:hypothetical protein CBL_09752 [Carabus blaptoides fortunei]
MIVNLTDVTLHFTKEILVVATSIEVDFVLESTLISTWIEIDVFDQRLPDHVISMYLAPKWGLTPSNLASGLPWKRIRRIDLCRIYFGHAYYLPATTTNTAVHTCTNPATSNIVPQCKALRRYTDATDNDPEDQHNMYITVLMFAHAFVRLTVHSVVGLTN